MQKFRFQTSALQTLALWRQGLVADDRQGKSFSGCRGANVLSRLYAPLLIRTKGLILTSEWRGRVVKFFYLLVFNVYFIFTHLYSMLISIAVFLSTRGSLSRCEAAFLLSSSV